MKCSNFCQSCARHSRTVSGVTFAGPCVCMLQLTKNTVPALRNLILLPHLKSVVLHFDPGTCIFGHKLDAVDNKNIIIKNENNFHLLSS